MSNASGAIRIGISGWRYEPWRGSFYPKGLKQDNELQYASRQLPAIEINGSFYSLQKPEFYARWAADTPGGFQFTVKAPRFITHIRRLVEPEAPMANYFASGLFELGDKLGPVLWQIPPSMKFDAEKFEAFFKLLPHTPDEAAALARKREARMKGRESLKPKSDAPLRHAVEVRNDSFIDPAFIDMLRHHQVAMVIADTGGRWPEYEDLTADFCYLRLHGASELYATGYSDAQLQDWAKRIRAWAGGGQREGAKLISDKAAPKKATARDVFCFFDNTMKVEAPNNARHLMKTLGLPMEPVVPGDA